MHERTVFVDGVGVAGTDSILQTDQKSLAHVPMMLLRDPKSVLTVGFGSGGCSHSMLLHDRLERVDCVEICPTVLEAAPYLTAANHRLLGHIEPPGAELDPEATFEIVPTEPDPRYRIILDDARSWLRYTDDRYDVIATDCTDLRYKSNANLYDLEYFQACRDRLTDEGIVVVWMPLAGLSLDVFKIALRTFHRVFPAMGIFYMDNEPTHYILLIGWQDRVMLDYSLCEKTLAEPDVRDDMAEFYLDDSVKLLSCFITGGDVLDEFLAGDEINTQNEPLIEFLSPKYGYADKPLIDNLDALMRIRVSPRRFLKEGSASPDVLARLERFEQALPWIVKGHAANRNLDIEQATRDYMKAQELTPDDLSLSRNLLTFPILQRRIQTEPSNPYPYMMLGRIYMIRNRPEVAYDLLTKAEALLRERVIQQPSPQNEQFHNNVRIWLRQLTQERTTNEE